MNKLKFSLTAFVILVVSSFMPVLQVLIMYLNSIIAEPIGVLLSKNDSIGMYLVNSLFSLTMLVLFYFSNTTVAKIFSTIGFLLFFLPLFFYSTTNLFTDETGRSRLERFYFLQFLIAGFVAGLLLVVIELIKSKKTN
ncbi:MULTISPECIES: hypothetical protein [unclassified Sphingobacterium]|uniref:hypothetical protein n=1 Tax=unclassified Sphingobacterium TaxID=2609468 RepID=UPI001047EA18|nr:MULTISPECIES: hypothetical protein [unclassified Sphingobacterium]MCS3556781.1 hypothetical protein [Sphingobacterium sp. JUb21]TCQ99291.1 hypothetical protein EDF66_115104 [Sphingobacterium sp. JUb20]